MIIDTYVGEDEISCQAKITYCVIVPPWKGSAINCPSDADYYGYSDIEFELLETEKYSAEELERKLTDDDMTRITAEFLDDIKYEGF